MSPTSRLKRALVTLLLHFARIYAITVDVRRDSPDTDVKKAFRTVILKAHPDNVEGSADAAKKLTVAYGDWQDSLKSPGKAGRPTGAAPKTDRESMASTGGPGAKRNKEYRVNSEAVLLTYQGFPDLGSWLAFCSFLEQQPKTWRVKRWSATLETNEDGSLHAHVMLQFYS